YLSRLIGSQTNRHFQRAKRSFGQEQKKRRGVDRVATVFHFQAADAVHTARVQEFQRDVTADIGNCIRRHITTGDPAGLSQATYYELRRMVADWLSLHPSAIVVVGSCRTGFTIKPDKRYTPFTSASDIDVAVVSESWFDTIWDDIFMATQPNRDWVLTNKE